MKDNDSNKEAPNLQLLKLGNRIRQLRLKKGISSENFAHEFNISRSLYGSYERGTQNITYLNLLKIIDALGLTVKEFFSEGFDEGK